MPTAADIAMIGYSYFISRLKSPRKEITPDKARQFTMDVVRLIIDIKAGRATRAHLMAYLVGICKYYGADPPDVANYFLSNPEFINYFLQYARSFLVEPVPDSYIKAIVKGAGEQMKRQPEQKIEISLVAVLAALYILTMD